MSTEVVIALVGVAGALLGAVVQYLLGEVARVREGRKELRRTWADTLVQLLHAGQAVERHVASATRSADRQAELATELDETWAQVSLLCPLELTRPAAQYLRAAHAVLRAGASEDGREVRCTDALDQAEQELGLVFRRVSGINQALPWRQRGERARLDIAEQYR